MNADRLLAHYDRIADAPDAIPRLRRFILDLAVRGTLVPQDPNDEPASELLKRIATEKARSGNVACVRKPALFAAKGTDEAPFALPDTWKWVRVGDVFKYDAGAKREPKELLPERWLLELEDIEKDTSNVLSRVRAGERSSLSTKSEFQIGDILYGKLRPYLNKVVVADEAGYSTTEIVVIRPFLELCPHYCALALRRPDFVAYVERLGRGTKMPRLRTPDALVAFFPLPPVAEQHRIVAKVDELMALCDRLETARTAREATRSRLTTASLASLNAPDPDPGAFRGHALFALDNLATLTTRPDQIKQLRQTILNLAVRGKLTAQDPNDEPASELLKRIAAQRRSTATNKGVRKKQPVMPLRKASIEVPPRGWAEEPLGNLVDPKATISYGVLVPGPDVEDGIPFVRAQDLYLSDHPERPTKTIAPEVEAVYARTRLKGGEILLCVVGSIGKIGTVPQSWRGANIARAVARIAPVPSVSTEYLVAVLRSEETQRYFADVTRTLAQPTLNVGLIEQLPVPIPPIVEQRRIVAKVDELIALCDRLEASLTETAKARRGLLDTLLAEALAQDQVLRREVAA